MTDKNLVETIDLVDEMEWEDCDKIEKLTLEEAGLEEWNPMDSVFAAGIYQYLEWFYDGESSEFDR